MSPMTWLDWTPRRELADHGSGEDGVFAGVLEVAAVARLADEVDAAADGHVVALGAQLAADDGAVEEGGVGIPARRHAEGGGQRRGVAALMGGHADADGGVGEVDVGNAEARDAGDEAGAAVVLGRGVGTLRRTPQPMPWTSWIFSSSVISWITRSARVSGSSEVFIHGGEAGPAEAGARRGAGVAGVCAGAARLSTVQQESRRRRRAFGKGEFLSNRSSLQRQLAVGSCLLAGDGDVAHGLVPKPFAELGQIQAARRTRACPTTRCSRCPSSGPAGEC